MTDGNPFDAGVIVEDYPGYKWPLARWREYCWVNGPNGTGAIPYDKFMRESPKAWEALQKSDEQYRQFSEVMNNPQAASVLLETVKLMTAGHAQPLSEVVTHLAAHKAVRLTEEMNTGDAPLAMQAGSHTHTFAKGDKKTGAAEGHSHDVGGDGECADAAGHSHAMSTMNVG